MSASYGAPEPFMTAAQDHVMARRNAGRSFSSEHTPTLTSPLHRYFRKVGIWAALGFFSGIGVCPGKINEAAGQLKEEGDCSSPAIQHTDAGISWSD